MLKKKMTAQERREKKILNLAIENAQYERNWKAMSFCLSHGFTVYPALQLGGVRLRIFMQKGEIFKPISDTLYEQHEPQEIKRMIYDIDQKYIELYNIHKDKGKGEL